jgi:hypothetical protein
MGKKKKKHTAKTKSLNEQIQVLPYVPGAQVSETVVRALKPHVRPGKAKPGFGTGKEGLDGRDPEIISYLEEFLQTWHKDLYMQPFSLLTPEAANEAVVLLSEKLNVLNQKLRTIRGIRTLLEAKKSEIG